MGNQYHTHPGCFQNMADQMPVIFHGNTGSAFPLHHHGTHIQPHHISLLKAIRERKPSGWKQECRIRNQIAFLLQSSLTESLPGNGFPGNDAGITLHIFYNIRLGKKFRLNRAAKKNCHCSLPGKKKIRSLQFLQKFRIAIIISSDRNIHLPQISSANLTETIAHGRLRILQYMLPQVIPGMDEQVLPYLTFLNEHCHSLQRVGLILRKAVGHHDRRLGKHTDHRIDNGFTSMISASGMHIQNNFVLFPMITPHSARFPPFFQAVFQISTLATDPFVSRYDTTSDTPSAHAEKSVPSGGIPWKAAFFPSCPVPSRLQPPP